MSNSSAFLDAGNWGEDLAVHHLSMLGYSILHRNLWLNIPDVGRREVDIVAKKDSELWLVEVRTRTYKNKSSIFVSPAESILGKKLLHMQQAAEFLSENISIVDAQDVKSIRMALISVIKSDRDVDIKLIPI